MRATKLGRAVWLEAKYLFIQGRSRPLYFLGRRTNAVRWHTAAAAMTGCFALGAAFGATVLVPLV